MSGYQVQEIVDFVADVALVRTMLFETWRYPEFIEHINSAEILSRSDTENEVAFRAKFILELNYTVRTWLTEDGGVAFEQKTGHGTLRGRWFFLEPEAEPESAADSSGCRARYELSAEVPPLLPAFVIESIMQAQLPRMLGDFRRRAEELASAASL